MKCYKMNKDRNWAQQVSQDQLYQVFHCFSEDQINYYEGFELALLERRGDELNVDKSGISYYTQMSHDVHVDDDKSDTSAAMREYMKQRTQNIFVQQK